MILFCVEAMVRGYHTYQSVWTAVVREKLPCQRETVNPRGPFAVAVLKDVAIVGHVPRKIFLRRNGSISCRLTESRRYFKDLVAGGSDTACCMHATCLASSPDLLLTLLRVSCMHHGIKIRDSYFHVLYLLAKKTAKFCTSRKIPAIQ